jgi:hypothetical protein
MSPRPPRTRAITTAVVAALLIGGGAYVGHLSQQNKDSINSDINSGALVDNNDPAVPARQDRGDRRRRALRRGRDRRRPPRVRFFSSTGPRAPA